MIVEQLIFSGYAFTGKHARYVKDLVSDRETSFFPSNISLLIAAAHVGIAMNKRGVREQGGDTTKIEKETFLIANPEVQFALELAVMNTQDVGEDLEDRLKRLYESKVVPQDFKDLIESYFLGGIEYLHDQLWSAGATVQEKAMVMATFMMNLNAPNAGKQALDIVTKADAIQ